MAERLSDPVERRAWLTFVIVGAGPTGVETGRSHWRDCATNTKERLPFHTPGGGENHPAGWSTSGAHDHSRRTWRERQQHSLSKLGVEVKCGAMVQHVDKDGLTIASDGKTDSIASKTVIWAGGITASPLGKLLAGRTRAETDKGGRVKVKPDLTIPNYPDIYVVGDLASSVDEQGRPLPGLAQVAMQGGTYAANAILRDIKGRPAPPPFRYFDKGSLAVIGRAAAVANVFGAHLSGLLAWLVWAFIHLMYLITFSESNRRSSFSGQSRT